MRSKKLLVCLLAAGAALSATPVLTGCAGEAYIVDTAPPAPRAEVSVHRPGYVWVHGHWQRRGSSWRWHPGYYERDRADMVYIHGRWDRRGRSYVWVDGGWRPRASVTIRGRL
jgi:hypothetical protein